MENVYSERGSVLQGGGRSDGTADQILELTSDGVAGGGEPESKASNNMESQDSNNIGGHAEQGVRPGVYKLPRAADVEVTTHVMVMKAMSTHSPLLLLILEGDTWVLPSGTARIGELPFAAGMRGLMDVLKNFLRINRQEFLEIYINDPFSANLW